MRSDWYEEEWQDGLTDEEINEEMVRILEENSEDIRKDFEEIRNIRRDSRGRLNRGARLAEKESCNAVIIRMYLDLDYSVKEIVERMGCSKSTVYRVRKQYLENLKNGDYIVPY